MLTATCALRKHSAIILSCCVLTSCYTQDLRDFEPPSDADSVVLQEYRRFIVENDTDFGGREVAADGTVVERPRPDGLGDGLPIRPPVVEDLVAPGNDDPFWWQAQLREPMFEDEQASGFEIGELIDRSLQRSNQLRVFADLPLIRETTISEAEGQFDPVVFADADVGILRRPTGSILDTGDPDITELRETDSEVRAGVAVPLTTGGSVTASQAIGTRESNSTLIAPNDQGLAEWRLEFRQPILEQAGVAVNLAPVRVATLDRDVSVAELQRQVESHLLEIIRTYWTIYSERATVLQRQRLSQDTGNVLNQLSARRGVDSLPSEVAQARSANERAKSSVIRARQGIDNAEARMASLLSDPSLFRPGVEILPQQPAVRRFVDVPLEDVAVLALENRSEIRQAVKRLQAAELRRDVAEDRLLPQLDLIAAVFNEGLNEDFRIGESIGDTFAGGDPSLEVGIELRVPLQNTADRAVYDRRRLEVRQLVNQLQTTTDTVLLESQVAVRELRTAYEELLARESALTAANTEVQSLRARGPLDLEGNAFLALLLDALERRTEAEEAYTRAEVTYNLALYTLERAAGTLLSGREIGATRVDDELLDYILLVRPSLALPEGQLNIFRDAEGTRVPDRRLPASRVPVSDAG